MTQIERSLKLMELEQEKTKLLASSSLCNFMTYINPRYEMQWFHKMIAKKCEELIKGNIKNLMVFVPPQHGKSEIISRCFPAFALGVDPNLKIAGCSYSSDLANGFSRSIQRIIDDRLYSEIFPETYLNGSKERESVRGYLRNIDMFECVNHTGFYKAIGVGGGLTGTPVDIAIIDDPVKDAMEAYSITHRSRVWDWYNSVLCTRLHNNSKQLFIMTRWHEDDLAGRILKAEGEKWEVLSIPAIKETNENAFDPRNIGEALWEEKHSLQKLLAQKARSPRTFSALYQQRPTIEGGNIVKEDWLPIISKSDFYVLRHKEPVHFFVDTAYDEKKQKNDNDPTGIIAVCKINHNIYVMNAKKVWKDFPSLIKFLPEWCYANSYDKLNSTIRIEPKANGKSVCQQLKQVSELNVAYTPTPTESKDVRLHAVTPKMECGRVYLVEGDWNEEFITEVTSFPSAPHDEYVDILGYAINFFFNDETEIPDNLDDYFTI